MVDMRSEVVVAAVKAARRQKVIIELADIGGPEWLLMWQGGHVEGFDTALAAFKAVQRRAAKGNKGVTVTTIEWRNVPQGFVPPKGVTRG